MTDNIERTACLIKPDAFPMFAGEIISRLLNQKFRIVLAGTVNLDAEDVEDLYDQHIGALYYENLRDCMMAGPVFAMILEKKEAISHLRFIMGPTHIASRKFGELRYEFGDPVNTAKNVLHGSDSVIRATYEIDLIKEWLRR